MINTVWVVLHFHNNFGKYKPIFKILLLLERG